jgi:hypothetical protein
MQTSEIDTEVEIVFPFLKSHLSHYLNSNGKTCPCQLHILDFHFVIETPESKRGPRFVSLRIVYLFGSRTIKTLFQVSQCFAGHERDAIET